jgi:hypothetical protein
MAAEVGQSELQIFSENWSVFDATLHNRGMSGPNLVWNGLSSRCSKRDPRMFTATSDLRLPHQEESTNSGKEPRSQNATLSRSTIFATDEISSS